MPRLPRSTTAAVALATLLALATHPTPASAQRQLAVPLTLRRGGPPRALEGGAAALPLDGAIRDAGYFTATLAIGTPPLAFDVIIDTGSTMTYVPCAGCGRACGPHHQAGFSVDASTTARSVRCGAPDCACGTKACGCAEAGDRCTFSREYAEQSSVGGLVVSDVVALPPEVGAEAGATPHPPARITLGCTTKETGEIYAQRAAGVAGLGNATTGLVAQLAAAGAVDRPAFALCLAPDPDPGAANHNGVLVLGGGAVRSARGSLRGDPVRTALAPAAAFYAVAVASMALVGAGEDGGSAAITELGSGAVWAPGTVVDSGSTFTFLPPAAAAALRGAAAAAADDAGFDRVSPPGTGYGDPCWDVVVGSQGNQTTAAVDAAVAAAFPAWHISFADGAAITLPATHYIVPHASRPGAACVAVYAAPEGRGGILGAASLRGLLVEVDAPTVTLARADCGALGGAAAAAAAGVAASRPVPAPGWANAAAAVPHQRVALGVAVVAAAAAVGSAAAVLIRRRRRRLRAHGKLAGSQVDMVGHGQRSRDAVEMGRV